MLTCQKDAFSLPADLHYLNCAYMSPVSKAVEAAGIAGIRRKRDPSEIGPGAFFDESDRVRERFAALVNAPSPADIAIIPSASYGLATVARNVRARPGQRIVLTGEQFPSNVYAWRRLAGEQGLDVHTVAPPDAGPQRGARWNQRLLEAIDHRTALVALGHVHWTDGTRFDLEAVGRRARDVGALFVVDGTQSVGALPFDVDVIQPDALVCAGYKWLLGPYGIGLAYYGPRLQDGLPLEDNWITRRRSDEFSRLIDYEDHYQGGAVRFDVGERSNFILLPMLLAALEQLHDWGVGAIQTYCERLTAGLVTEARALGYRVEDRAARAAHLFGVRLPEGASMDRLRQALARARVSVSLRGTAVRIAPHLYNDEADVEALLDALRRAVEVP